MNADAMQELYLSLLFLNTRNRESKKDFMERVKKGFQEIDISILKKQNGNVLQEEYPTIKRNMIVNSHFKDIFFILCYIAMRPSLAVLEFGQIEFEEFIEEIIEIILERDTKWVPSYDAFRGVVMLNSEKIARMFLDRCIAVHSENRYLKEDEEYTATHKKPGLFSESILMVRIELSKLFLDYGWNLSMVTYYHSEKTRIRDLFKDPSVPYTMEEFYETLIQYEMDVCDLIKEPQE